MPEAAAASARDDPSSTWAIAKIRQATRPSWLREATRRSFAADRSSRVTSICRPMMSSVARGCAATENLTCRQMGTSKSHESQDFRRLVTDEEIERLYNYIRRDLERRLARLSPKPVEPIAEDATETPDLSK